MKYLRQDSHSLRNKYMCVSSTNKYFVHLCLNPLFFPHLQQLGTRWATEPWPALRFRRPSACGCARRSISHGKNPHTLTRAHASFYHLSVLSVPFALLFVFSFYPPLAMCAFYLNRFTLGGFWWLSLIVNLGVQINLKSYLWRNYVSLYCFGKHSMSCCVGLHLGETNESGESSRPDDGFSDGFFF